jgi:hypothetical protein
VLRDKLKPSALFLRLSSVWSTRRPKTPNITDTANFASDDDWQAEEKEIERLHCELAEELNRRVASQETHQTPTSE